MAKINLIELPSIPHVFEVEGTDYIVETMGKVEEKDFIIESWLYKKDYGVKMFMFGLTNSKDYREIIESNVDEYIEIYNEEYDVE